MHFFSYLNNTKAISKLLSDNPIYTKDAQNRTPLEIAMLRKSYDVSAL